MNVEELNEDVRANQKRKIQEAIKEIEKRIKDRANRGFSNLRVATDRISDIYEIDYYMIEPLRDYFIENGYRVELEEIKGFTRWLEDLFYKVYFGGYVPDYYMIISWE